MVIFNTGSSWTGNWTSAGVANIKCWVNNISGSAINLRVAIDGDSGKYCTTASYTVGAGSGWIQLTIPVTAASWTSVGGTNIAGTLANVTHFRFLNNSSASFLGVNSTNTFGIDSIVAIC